MWEQKMSTHALLLMYCRAPHALPHVPPLISYACSTRVMRRQYAWPVGNASCRIAG